MRLPQPWLERHFAFGLDPALLPNQMARLCDAPLRLAGLLRAQDPARLTRGMDGGWSPLVHAGHLGDLEPLWLARVKDFQARRPDLATADISNRLTSERDHDRRPVEDVIAEFVRGREALIRALENTSAAARQHAGRHPRLGVELKLVDHAWFVAEHDDHHLATIRALFEE